MEGGDECHTSLFGGLSLSSLDTGDDGGASEDDVSTQTELCQRLRELDEITSNFLDTRPLLLSSAYSSYLELEPGQAQELKLVLPCFSVTDVLVISVACLNGCTQQGDISLSLQQQRQTPEGSVYRSSIPFRGESSTSSTAGTCDATFSAADGIVKGTYFVKLTNLTKQQVASSQQLRIQYQVSPCVRANPIETGETIRGSVGCHQFAFFRYNLPDASKLLSICCVRPDVGGNAGCDIYVTNRYHGLVGVDRATAQWSSQVGYARVDIHPKDEKASLGNTFVIGIVGYGDVNQYELTVQLRDPSHIQAYAVGDALPVTVNPGQSSFFALRVDTRVSGRIILRLLPSGSKSNSEEVEVNTTTGRCVYGSDWLGQSADVFAITTALPVMYFSAVAMYPSEDAYTWRISDDPRNASPCCALETDDWHNTSEMCYFSISGLGGNSSAQFMLSSSFRPDSDHLSHLEKDRQLVFEQIFAGIDGPLASQKDRTREGLAAVSTSIDALALTYGEITYVGFVELLSYLRSLDCANGRKSAVEPASFNDEGGRSPIRQSPPLRRIFYDLGCGSGKALVAAALSGAFLRCVGVELLPSLCACAETAAERVGSLASASEAETCCPITVVRGDAISVPLDEAGVVFVSSLCFPDSIMNAILDRCAKSRPGMILCTLQLPTGWEAVFTHEGHVWIKMSWSKIRVHVLRRF